MGNLVLDSGGESVVELSVKGGVIPLDMCHKVVEVNEILYYMLVITHVKVLKFGFGFGFRIMWPEVIYSSVSQQSWNSCQAKVGYCHRLTTVQANPAQFL